MKPAAAWACLVLILAGLALAAYLSPRAYRHGHVPLEKPPEALAERSKEIIRRFGYTEKPLGIAWGFSGNGEYRSWVEEHDKSKNRWKDMEDGRPAAIFFWYRQSPGQLIPERFRGEDFGGVQMTESDPPLTTSGMVGVELDPLGRLIRFEAVPSSGPQVSSGAIDWSILLAEAGLDAAAFSPAEPQWLPPSYADARAAWVESKPERPGRPMRVEAAAVSGRPVFFELAGPWSSPPRTARTAELTGANRDFDLLFLGVLVVGGALIARRNLRLGRSDRRGAMRLAALTFVGSMLTWAFRASHVADDSELALLLLGASVSLLLAGVSWLLYVALEPLIRRRWPDSLIAWTRLLSGRLSDPLVGRVLLAGALVGVFGAIFRELRELALRAFEATPPIPPFPWDLTLRGPRAVATHISNPAVAMFFALATAMLFFLLRVILRKEWLAAAVFVLFFAVPSFLDGGLISGAFALVVAAVVIFLFLRFGLLALVFANYFGHCLQFPLTTDSSAWYAGTSLFVLSVLAALAIYGFRIALAGRPMFSGMRLED
jgi:serine/threonine-protein kinase